MKKRTYLFLLVAILVVTSTIAGCSNPKPEASELKNGTAIVLEKRFISGDTGVSLSITGGSPGSLSLGTGGVGIGLGGGLQFDLDPDPDQFLITLSFNGEQFTKAVSKERFEKIKRGDEVNILYREIKWLKDGLVVHTEIHLKKMS